MAISAREIILLVRLNPSDRKILISRKIQRRLFFFTFFFIRDHCEQPDRNKDLYEELRSDMHRLNGRWTAEKRRFTDRLKRTHREEIGHHCAETRRQAGLRDET